MSLITRLFAPQEGKSVPFQLKEGSFAFFNVKTALALAPLGPPPAYFLG